MTQLPSDQLKQKPRPIRAALIGLGAAAVIVGGTFGGIATANALTPAPKLAPALQIAGPMECDGTVVGQGTCITAADQTAASGQEQAIEDANSAKAAADAAAAQAAQAAADQAARDAAAKKTAQRNTATGPTKCPAGYSANAVDANGNESNCQKDSDSGQRCQAYDDNNNCTAWGALRITPLKP